MKLEHGLLGQGDSVSHASGSRVLMRGTVIRTDGSAPQVQSDEASGHLPILLAVVCKQGLLSMAGSELAELPAGAHNCTGKKTVPASERRHVPKYTWEFRKFISSHQGTVSGLPSTPDHRNLKSVLFSQERRICSRWDKASVPQEAFHTAPRSRRGPAHKSVLSTTNPAKIECVHFEGGIKQLFTQ